MATATATPQTLPTLKPAGLIELLTKAIPKRRPILIAGAPGIGKTQIVEQTTAALGYDLIVSHPAVSDPTDFKGLPWFDAKSKTADFRPIGEFAAALAATKPTVWFFDDLAQAPESVQAACMQLFLARRVGEHRLPDCVTFVACTNGRQHRAGARGLLEPVKSRFDTIIELIACIDSWSRWAFDNDISPMLIAFLRYRPELLSKFEASADLTNSPSPRTWQHAANIEDLDLSPGVESVALAGAVGEAAATEYQVFRRMYKSLVNVDAIITNPDTAAIPTAPSELYAVSVALAGKANTQNFGRIIRYSERLADANKGEFAVLALRSATDRDDKLIYTDAYVRAQTGKIGELISGTIR
jgi:hypothetical protein